MFPCSWFASVAQLAEQLTLNQLVLGSSPSRGTSITEENRASGDYRTDSAQNQVESERGNLRFPKTVRHRKAECRIYGKSKAYPFYRVCGYVAGKRRMTSYPSYSEAKAAADKLVREIASGSQTAALTSRQAADALAALERLQGLYQSTGRRVSILAGIAEYCEAVAKLGEHTLGEAVESYLSSLVKVKRQDIGKATEEFIEARKPLAESKDGRRSQLSPVYAANVAMWLREFSKTFPGHAVCDLTKQHLQSYVGHYSKLSAKSRNDRRATLKMFIRWAVEQDYLPATHRLFEASGGLKPEKVDAGETDFYRPAELRAMLEGATGEFRDLLPVLALNGLAGLRVEEIMRATWADVWRVPGHVEIVARKSKTRARRLVEVCSALAAWLAPFKEFSGQVWKLSSDSFHESFTRLRESVEIPARRNGLRHAFCTYHFAAHANENLTAAQAGNSPAMIHQHYKGLATKAEAEKWFAVLPMGGAKNIIHVNARAASA